MNVRMARTRMQPQESGRTPNPFAFVGALEADGFVVFIRLTQESNAITLTLADNARRYRRPAYRRAPAIEAITAPDYASD